ncbi:helix-turn-helix domain-containing protein [Thermococcus sp. MV5]|uniref:helix-turn-helix domain-containing protein n=1 Tax=Thermococcus sp. MV5 TaxID=1638272 RepID=UPI003211F192
MPMKRIKFKVPLNQEMFVMFKEFLKAIEWGYGDTYFILDDEIIKITEVKFKEGVNPEEIIGNLRKLPHVKELKLLPKNDHHIIYSKIDMKNIPFPTKQVDKILDLQRKGLVIFEKGTFDGNSIILYVICEDSLPSEVISTVREVYNGSILSIEDYVSEDNPLLKLSKRQREILLLAYKSGYFDNPHKVTLKDLAEMLGLSVSTVKEHLRKAQRKILDEIIEG